MAERVFKSDAEGRRLFIGLARGRRHSQKGVQCEVTGAETCKGKEYG